MADSGTTSRDKARRRAADVRVVDLGLRLNHLLDQDTRLSRLAKPTGGLVLPAPKGAAPDEACDPLGSGIVVITGEPGSGKSTLGLQIAVAAADQGCDCAYLSLEEEPERIEKKADIFGWKSRLWPCEVPLDFMGDQQPFTHPGAPAFDATWLMPLLEKCRGAEREMGKILLPGLLPRPLASSEVRLTAFFWEQYRQIEFLVRSAADHNSSTAGGGSPGDHTGIRLIVIDSLNMLGVEPQNREMLHRLFDLFRQNRIMGIFTVEANRPLGFDSTMGDVVFTFSRHIDSGYEVTLLECTKTRFSSRTKGLHPYKFKPIERNEPDNPGSAPCAEAEARNDSQAARGEIGIVVFPSPHAVVAATESPGDQQGFDRGRAAFPFGWGDAITGHLLRSSLHRGSVVALAGPSGTFKTKVAFNFLLHGIAVGETVLYLRLRTPELLNLGEEMMGYGPPKVAQGQEQSELSNGEPEEERRRRARVNELRDAIELDPHSNEFCQISSRTKVQVSVYRDLKTKGSKETFPRLILADFRTGMLLAEEFIDVVRRIFDECGPDTIKRVVLDDVGAIGVSYPLLKHSITTGDLFLSAFVHVMKNKKADLLVVGRTGDLPESNHMVQQACNLADGVLRTSVGTVFGDKYVLLTGDGMAATQPNRGESPPVVLLPSPLTKTLTPDAQLLDEFVGFESGRITRPGIVLHLYEESDVQRSYNRGLLKRLEERYGTSSRRGERSEGVRLVSFSPGGLTQLGPTELNSDQERPRDHTAVRIIDEFENRATPALPCFMRNVLLMAYRSDVEGAEGLQSCRTWQHVQSLIDKLPLPPPPAHLRTEGTQGTGGAVGTEQAYGRKFCFSRVAPETLSCLVLDAIATAGAIDLAGGKDIPFPGQFPDNGRVGEEFAALHDLLFHQVWRDSERGGITDEQRQELSRSPLAPDAAVYVFWYSQLRELLVREPHLTQLLRVQKLPGGGFTGDWYVKVEPGSVSLRLGESIVRHLVSAGEDYERFRVGLSLPVAPGLGQSDLLAWHGAHPETKVQDIESIWSGANRRSRIKDYRRFNHLLSTVGEVLSGKYLDPRNASARVDAQDLARRLPGLVAALCKASETDSTGLPPG